ncbi:MAG: dihydrofolate reductase, partial [Oxalobacteraceae bacterium]
MITLIAAMDEARVIGANNALPWHLPADFAHFKATTMKQTIIMGRLTFESLPLRPLPHRRNIVVTRDLDYTRNGIEVAH